MEYLKRFEEPFRVGYEASCGYGPLHDRLVEKADEVHEVVQTLVFDSVANSL